MGILATKKSNSSNNNKAAYPIKSNSPFESKVNRISAPVNTGKPPIEEVIPPSHVLSSIKSKLNWKMLEAFESLTEYTDFPLIAQLSLTEEYGDKVGFVQPDDRLIK